MKFLIIHNRYYHVSGPETYLFNLRDQIENMGHSVDIFSLDYERNVEAKNINFFPKPIGDNSNYSFKNQRLSLLDKLKIITSLFYRHDVYKKLNSLLSSNNYDGAVVLQFWGKLSPAIFKSLKNNNIPTALRISDFGLICGTNTLLKNNKHSDECITNKYGCVKNKCVNDSYFRSLINTFAQGYFYKKYSDDIDFIFTCKNTQSIFKEAGYKINSFHLPTFYPKEFIEKKSFKSKKIIYLGRVADDKGLHNILPLVPDSNKIIFEIWGSGLPEYTSMLKKIISNRINKNIHIMGEANRDDVSKIFKDCMFSIIPSRWHDNLPNSLIESLSNGVPVIVPNYGCFPEFVTNNMNGFLYNNYDDLREVFSKIIDLNDVEKSALSSNATMFAKETFSSKIHVQRLLEIISRNHEKNT